MKKVLALVMAALMVVGLFAGCGAKSEYDPNTIRIGMSGPLTGGAAVYGTAVKAAMEIAVEEVNALGGLQFELNVQDDEADSEMAVNAYNTLMDWGMQIMAGPVTTAPSNVVAAECANDEIFMLTPSASGVSVIEYGDNIFQICFTDPNQGMGSARYIKTNNMASKVGVIYDMPNFDAIYTGYLGSFEQLALVEKFFDDFKKDVIGYVEDSKHVLYEDKNAETVHFALIFQFEGDDKATKHVMYNCTATRPSAAGNTKAESVEPQTESVTITATSVYNATLDADIVKAEANGDSDSTTYSNWFNTVYLPTAPSTST